MMNMVSRFLTAGLISISLACCLFFTGCGSSGPETVPVCGQLTLDGQPLGVGQVTFLPVAIPAGGLTRPASALVKDDGTFEMTSFSPGDGVVPGKYQVTINTMTSAPFAPEVWAAPKRYSNPGKSGFEITVESGGDPMDVQFDLVSK